MIAGLHLVVPDSTAAELALCVCQKHEAQHWISVLYRCVLGVSTKLICCGSQYRAGLCKIEEYHSASSMGDPSESGKTNASISAMSSSLPGLTAGARCSAEGSGYCPRGEIRSGRFGIQAYQEGGSV